RSIFYIMLFGSLLLINCNFYHWLPRNNRFKFPGFIWRYFKSYKIYIVTKKELFEPKNIYLTAPEGFELLPELIGMLGYSADHYDIKKTKEDVLASLRILS